MDQFSIRVIIADDHPAVLVGIKQALVDINTIDLKDAARNSTALIELLDKTACDVLVTDYTMPGGEYGDGLALFEFILRRYPNIKIVVMTMLDNPALLRALITQGVHCVLSKSDDSTHLVPAIHIAFSGGQYFSPTMSAIIKALNIRPLGLSASSELTKRETEVLRLYVSGLTINEVAKRLHRSKQTVSSQKNSAKKKLGIERDADLFKYAMDIDLVSPSFI